MGVVTVIAEEGVQVLVEFVGGPRDGKRSFAVASTDSEGKPVPPYGFDPGQLPESPVDGTEPVEIGRYVRDGLTPDGEAYGYVWRTATGLTEAPLRDPSPPDLATRIRHDYARRVLEDAEQAMAPKPSPKSRSGTGNRRGS
jgi:hypothetical protein